MNSAGVFTACAADSRGLVLFARGGETNYSFPRMRSKSNYLQECREVAESRGGRCLSTYYISADTPLRWRCNKGHEWDAVPGNVKRGRWCFECFNEKRRAANFERVKQIAHKHGGRCVSKIYIASHYHLCWRCAHGHEWLTTPEKIAQGNWCPRCAGVDKWTLAEMQQLARRRGGTCLSDGYVNVKTPLLWRCREGHEWHAPPNRLLDQQSWCPHCAGKHKTLDDIRALAEAHQGELLSRRIGRMDVPLRWRCHLGHHFNASPNRVQQGGWCPRCYAAPQLDLVTLRAIARRRGGQCLSERYEGSTVKLLWRCSDGHEWEAIPSAITAGQWCPTCSRSRGKGSRPRLGIADMQKTAEARGGDCLSKRYVNVTTKLRWRCASGHEWHATPNSVRAGSWCPKCSHRYRGSIEGLQLLASDRGGRCLSKRYEGKRTLVEWECAHRHRFELTSLAAKSGAWCPLCEAGDLGAAGGRV